MTDSPELASAVAELPDAGQIAGTLSAPQLDLLRDVCLHSSLGVSESYKPARKLVALGLVTLHDRRFGGKAAKPTELGLRVHLASRPLRGANDRTPTE